MSIKIKKIPFSQDELKELFEYNPENGILYNKTTRCGNCKKGSPAGCVKNTGYILLGIQWKTYLAHRIIWKIVHGNDPLEQLDHINHIRSDNRIENLREVTHGENHRNQKMDKGNKSGFTGVYFSKRANKWLANITINEERKHLGYFETFEQAKEARESANKKYNYSPNHGNN